MIIVIRDELFKSPVARTRICIPASGSYASAAPCSFPSRINAMTPPSKRGRTVAASRQHRNRRSPSTQLPQNPALESRQTKSQIEERGRAASMRPLRSGTRDYHENWPLRASGAFEVTAVKKIHGAGLSRPRNRADSRGSGAECGRASDLSFSRGDLREGVKRARN